MTEEQSQFFFELAQNQIKRVEDLDKLISFAIQSIFTKCFFLPVKVGQIGKL